MNKVIDRRQVATRRMEQGRLVYYRQAATSQYWDDYWSQFSEDFYKEARDGRIWVYLDHFFTKCLPKRGRILEAGCGMAQIVLALRNRGYDIEGIEWAVETVKRVKGFFPDLPVKCGDVTEIPVPDGYYAAYISLGVIEHRRNGPGPFLTEAYRVIAPGGVALVSVPYLNPIRAIKASLGLYRGVPNGLEFYQYAFSRDAMTELVRQHGFEIVEAQTYSLNKGIGDEIPGYYRLLRTRGVGKLMRTTLRKWDYAQRNLGHMIMFVLRKPN